jgi:hypothetical protein
MKLRVALSLSLTLSLFVLAAPASAKPDVFKVCKRGCEFRKIQSAVNASGRNDVVKVKPGKYVEGVIVRGHRHDGLTIKGTGKSPRAVILEGKGARVQGSLAQNGIESIRVNRIKVLNMWARNYQANGFFFREGCTDYLMKNLIASFNRAYGLFAFNCKGGRMTQSVGYGHGDSAFYVGQTPPQANPNWTSLDHLKGYMNVLGFSGSNSRYVNIHDSDFFNNGVGIGPNTIDTEKFEPADTGVIQDNNIFWNNFNYFLPRSKVKTVSDGLGTIGDPPNELTIQYPTGVGVALLGTEDWTVKNNRIFGNFQWGVFSVSNPFNEGDDAIVRDNRIVNNRMGRGESDVNGFDFMADGSGSGNCFLGNVSSTFNPSGTATQDFLYPSCPAPPPPASGSGTSSADPGQFGEIVAYVTQDPPSKMECSWTKHPHPPFKNYKPLNVPGAQCP